MSLNIVIDDAIVEAEALFSPYGNAIIVSGRDIPKYAAQADALIIRSRTTITEQLLSENPRIRFIGSTVVGLDHVDQDACQRHGVTFYSAQGCNARSVAEYVIYHIIHYAITQQRDFSDLTLAIIGVGHVGKQVAQLADALKIRLLLNDPFRRDNEADFTHTNLTDCLQRADIITLHTPLTDDGEYPTYQLINQSNINKIKKNTLFINAARGDIVDEYALLTRTDLTLITDCWHNEPQINEQLLKASLIATPHIAGHAWDAKYRGGYMTADALARWMRGTTPTSANLSPEESKTIPLALLSGKDTKKKTLTDQQQLAQLVQHTYNFNQDDMLLRNAPKIQRDKVFEDYRRNYPLRREWTKYRLASAGLSTQTLLWAKALGFLI